MLSSLAASLVFERMQSVPGYEAALKRGDRETVRRLISENLGLESEEAKLLMSDADLIFMSDAPSGTFTKSLHLVRGDHQLMIQNQSSEISTVEVAIIMQ
ncbi:MAG: hypothetical protein U0892_16690 [Pirellulales bacterium]